MNNRSLKGFSAAVMVSLLTTGCVMNSGDRVYDSEKELAGNYSSYNLTQSASSVSDNSLTGSALKMEGMGTVWRFDAEEETEVTITYMLDVSCGKAKLVLISPDDEVTTLVEYTEETSDGKEHTESFTVPAGENRIKLVAGRGTEIDYQIAADQGKMNSFGD